MIKQLLLSQACFGPVPYFVLISKAEKAIIEKHSNYQRQTYRNRYKILGANGPLTLSIPIEKGKNIKTKDKDVKIAYHTNWQANHWKSIVSAYNSSPFFQFYRDDFEPLFFDKHTYLLDLNLKITHLICQILDIDTPIETTSQYEKEPGNNIRDLREAIHPKKPVEKAALFVPTIPYKQVFDDRFGFVPNLSILDLLFNKGPEAALLLNETSMIN
ncbi:WbqC family protein [Thermophagus sp. OGC60D27]|uniref:WbqC family protein n=1 Tax=Thermophagus sp. OGC60D27 TaxID=3458415 RepID=UPI004037DDB9